MNEDDVDDRAVSFLMRSPIDEKETNLVSNFVKERIYTAVNILEQGGVNEFRKLCCNKDINNEIDIEKESSWDDALIKGVPRKYQLALFEKVKDRNTIVNLGTGKGKTLIGMMCIRHFGEEAFLKGKQTWFIVPSLALCVQQSLTLKANLPYKVATVSGTAQCSDSYRKELQSANIIVATHGSALDLLSYFGDMFSLTKVNLLILDECHNATKNHGYATIMRDFYHTITAVEKRPRIMGLTASPLINVKVNECTPESLSHRLVELERILNSCIVSMESIGLIADKSSGFITNNTREETIYYHPTITSELFPSTDGLKVHALRKREIDQLKFIFHDLGSLPTRDYCEVLNREVSRNNYEGETLEEFEALVSHLKSLAIFCNRLCSSAQNGGRSNKLILLEQRLESLFWDRKIYPDLSGEDMIGIIFVERRITAMALYSYLRKKYRTSDTNTQGTTIRCDMTMRQSTHIFKYLHSNHKLLDANKQELADQDWLHTASKIQDVLNGLRTKQTNLLIATSVVEEGVDIDACSFVIIFDGLKSTKGYVQMKGRARTEKAYFFVFQEYADKKSSSFISLEDAKFVEQKVADFIQTRITPDAMPALCQPPDLECFDHNQDSLSDEMKAVTKGEYRTSIAYVNLSSAKSLINRYAMGVPMDTRSRSSRETLKLHMPIYSSNCLILPAHLPRNLRMVHLPPCYDHFPQKDRLNILALMACVRLHKMNVLNDRLLPLGRKDMHDSILKKLIQKDYSTMKSNFRVAYNTLSLPIHSTPLLQVYIYPIHYMSGEFNSHDYALENNGASLGLLSLSPLPSIPSLSHFHKDFKQVTIAIGGMQSQTTITDNNWQLAIHFYTILINARWCRRTGKKKIVFRDPQEYVNIAPLYLIVSLENSASIDWNRMQNVVSNYHRTEEERKTAAQNHFRYQFQPKLWAPIYDPNMTNIAFQPSTQTCAAPFPHKQNQFRNYQEYFQKQRGFDVPLSCVLYSAQRLWHLPQTFAERDEDALKQRARGIERMKLENNSSANDTEYAPCAGLNPLLLPQSACMEAPLCDAALFLHCVLLPQTLYYINRCLTVHAFLRHCHKHLPILASYLSSIPLNEIMQVLTAKSTSLSATYDRLEYLGDAVLKLIHTDALMNLDEEELSIWINCLHEGDLSELRSLMGCNSRLHKVAKYARIDKFILTMPLGRGTWVPLGFEMVIMDQSSPSSPLNVDSCDVLLPSEKACADVIEALIGLVYLRFGYGASIKITEELGLCPKINFPSKEDVSQDLFPVNAEAQQKGQRQMDKIKYIHSFLGISNFDQHHLLEEALTHASYVHSDVPCYQKLEWIGDAVICLASREFVYGYKNLKVADLVIIETTLNCNETLAMLAYSKNLQDFIQHLDPSLPGRIQDYTESIQSNAGLWATDPPKVLADVVEALIGAVHVGQGFVQGQNTSRHVLSSIILALNQHIEPDSFHLQSKVELLMHPKQVLKQTKMFLSVKSMRENTFAVRHSNTPVWLGDHWGKADVNGNGAIGLVICSGLNVVAVLDKTSSAVARNRACALALSIFKKTPDILINLEQIVTALKQCSEMKE